MKNLVENVGAVETEKAKLEMGKNFFGLSLKSIQFQTERCATALPTKNGRNYRIMSVMREERSSSSLFSSSPLSVQFSPNGLNLK